MQQILGKVSHSQQESVAYSVGEREETSPGRELRHWDGEEEMTWSKESQEKGLWDITYFPQIQVNSIFQLNSKIVSSSVDTTFTD